MTPRVIFLIGAPRSGTTLLERILSSHSMIKGGPEPHLITPLAHLGVWANVDKAPYDHIVAGLGQRRFVDALPAGAKDYWAACRAYCDSLYAAWLAGSGKAICLDKTPEYATVLPFLGAVYPDASYVVLTRHPIAIFSSFANSFFGGDYEAAESHDDVLGRYVPAMARFLRQEDVGCLHVRYEDLVAEPEEIVRKVYAYLQVPNEPETIRYKKSGHAAAGLGDPIGVVAREKPTTDSLSTWVQELATDSTKLRQMQASIRRLDPSDLVTLGYPLESLWLQLDEAMKVGVTSGFPARNKPALRYSLERTAIVRGRKVVRRVAALKELVRTVRVACDVLLRE